VHYSSQITGNNTGDIGYWNMEHGVASDYNAGVIAKDGHTREFGFRNTQDHGCIQ
jgi:hypothetical protein